MIRDVTDIPPLLKNSSDFQKKHSDTIERWLDVLDRQDQIWMLHEMRDRISVSEFNDKFQAEESNNYFQVVRELREHGLAVKISNSELQPESADECLNNNGAGSDNWYHLTPLGLEFVRSIFDPDGPPLLAPALIADDLMGFINGLPDESRRIDEHLVRTDHYETESEFDNFREKVSKGDYSGSVAPPVIPEDPYLLSRQMDVTVYEGANTLGGSRSIQEKVSNAIQDRTQVRLFGPWAPTVSAQIFEETSDLPNMYHQFIAGRKFVEQVQSDEQTEPMREFLEQARAHSDIRVESTQRYLPYVFAILEDKERTDCELFIWGRGNPDTDSYLMFATADDPPESLYKWASDLFEYVAQNAEEYT